MPDFPKITAKKSVFTCPWISLVESQVRMEDTALREEAYYAIQQPDYITIVAQTHSGKLPIVRQYRPAVDAFTLELPAGILEKGELPEDAGRRELQEETGVIASESIFLGAFYADTGRLSNQQHVYFMRGPDPKPDFEREKGIEVLFKTKSEILRDIKNGTFKHQLHVGAFFLALDHLH